MSAEKILAEILRGDVPADRAKGYAAGKTSVTDPVGGYDSVRMGSSGAIVFLRQGGLSRLDGPALVAHDGKLSFHTFGHPVTFAAHLADRDLIPQPERIDELDGFVESIGDDVRAGRTDYYVLVDALRTGAPIEWAAAYARGEANA